MIPIQQVKANINKFGIAILPDLPADINNYNKPTGYATHFLGSDVLKRFHIIFDFQHHVLYLKPNSHFNDTYFG